MFNLKQQQAAINQVTALGEIAIASEYLMVIEGYEHLTFLTKGFALPLASAEEKIDVFLAGGIVTHTSPMAKTDFSHGLTITETVPGHALELFEAVAYERSITHRTKFNFTIYQGTVAEHVRKWPCSSALLHGFEPPEIDGENRTQIMQYAGNIAYHCFGSKKGNI